MFYLVSSFILNCVPEIISCTLAKTIPEWEYIRLSGHARVHWRLQDGSENSYELVLLVEYSSIELLCVVSF